MLSRGSVVRCFFTTSKKLAEAEKKISKDALMALRKKTGYSYVNCRKALVKFGENDMENAEKWLREAAAKEGWAKAAKLGSRVTSNGLVSVISDKNMAAIVELSCETDFVARADHFKNLLQSLSKSVLTKAQESNLQVHNGKMQQVSFELGDLSDTDGKNMRDVLSLAIGKLGENMNVKKLKAFKAPEGTTLFGSSHPKDGTETTPMGRFVSLIAMKQAQSGTISQEQLAGQICQHIIGMSPETLGEAPAKKTAGGVAVQQGHSSEEPPVEVTSLDDSETSLLRQNFMLNPTQTVHEYLSSQNAIVLDFARFELGNE